MSDWYVFSQAKGQRLQLVARTDFLNIEENFGKLPALTGNGDEIVKINAAGTALESISASSLGSLVSLSDLSDVTIMAVATGEILVWDGAEWANQTLAESGIAAAIHNHTVSEITDFLPKIAARVSLRI